MTVTTWRMRIKPKLHNKVTAHGLKSVFMYTHDTYTHTHTRILAYLSCMST